MDDEFDDILAEVNIPTESNQHSNKSDDSKAGTSEDVVRQQHPKTHCILVNQKQRGNPILKSITNVPWEFDDVIPDYEISRTVCALFLSLRYYNMNPDYINERLKELGHKYELRVLLVQVDLKEPHIPLKNLTRICLLADLTLMLAWSSEEAGRILENYKIYENKPPDRIMEKVDNDPQQKIINALSAVKPINKTDAMTLISTFGTLENIIQASEGNLSECPGVAARKAKKLYSVLHQPFLKRDNVDAHMFDEELVEDGSEGDRSAEISQ